MAAGKARLELVHVGLQAVQVGGRDVRVGVGRVRCETGGELFVACRPLRLPGLRIDFPNRLSVTHIRFSGFGIHSHQTNHRPDDPKPIQPRQRTFDAPCQMPIPAIGVMWKKCGALPMPSRSVEDVLAQKFLVEHTFVAGVVVRWPQHLGERAGVGRE
jgi:hypothetical protein